MANTTTKGNYEVEIDGIGKFWCTDVTMPDDKMTPHSSQAGNEVKPTHGMGNVEIGEATFMGALGRNQVDREIYSWYNRVAKLRLGDERKTIRVIIHDDAKRVPIRTKELIDCLITSFKADDLDGTSNDVMKFSFTVQPDDVRWI
ncbi:MAG TPA: phage tail protein [Pyrinomonadaceae bacterium]|jgi:phage tail-like protein